MNNQPKTPATRGVRTALQTIGGLLAGLVLTVWNVPGVPEAVRTYAEHNFLPLLLGAAVFVGIPAGLISFAQNKLEAKR